MNMRNLLGRENHLTVKYWPRLCPLFVCCFTFSFLLPFFMPFPHYIMIDYLGTDPDNSNYIYNDLRYRLDIRYPKSDKQNEKSNRQCPNIPNKLPPIT